MKPLILPHSAQQFSEQISRRSFLKMATVLSGFSLASCTGAKNSRRAFKMRFAIASDGHFGQPNTPFEENHRNIVSWFNAEHAVKPLDFCLFNGDLIHDNPTFLPQVKSFYDKLHAPYFVTRGNHDQTTTDFWRQTWGYNTNHAFEKQDYGFILLDNSNEKGEYLCPDAAYFGQQLQRFKNKKGVFVFMHIVPHKITANGIDCEPINALLASAKNLKGVFHGHDHDQDTSRNERGCMHLFDAHFGGNWGTAYKGYRVVEVGHDDKVRTYQYDANNAKIINENWII